MKRPLLALALGCSALTTMPVMAPEAAAQTRYEQRRFDAARERFDRERQIFERERQIYEDARRRSGNTGSWDRGNGYPAGGGGYSGGGYNNGTYNGGYNNGGYNNGGYQNDDRDGYDGGFDESRYRTDYDASRYYRDDARYTERRLGPNDQVYRGSDGRYYCKRNDGTTGLIIGGVGGAIAGNVIDGGRNRTAGTLIGGALGALLGRSVDQNSSDVRCR